MKKGIIINKNRIEPYKTKTRGIPKLRKGTDITHGDCIGFRITEAIHTLAHIDKKINSLDTGKQVVGSFKGFQGSFHEKVAKSEVYYYPTLPNHHTNQLLTKSCHL